MSRSHGRLAAAKAVGEDIERLAIDALDGLDAADDRDAWYDAVAAATICPRTAPAVRWAGLLVLERDQRVEIKAARRRVSDGSGERSGYWYFKRDQHGRLLDAAAAYLLVVYHDDGAAPTISDLLVVPATIVDEHLRERWYAVDRREGSVAQLAWDWLLPEDCDVE